MVKAIKTIDIAIERDNHSKGQFPLDESHIHARVHTHRHVHTHVNGNANN